MVNHNVVLSTTTDEGITTHVYSCGTCGAELDTRSVNISATGIDYYAHPSNRFQHRFKSGDSWGVTGNIYYDADEDVAYTRVNLTNWGEFEILNGTAEPVLNNPSQTMYGSGRYIVMKVRVGSGVTQPLNFIAIDGKAGNKVVQNNWIYNANGRTTWVKGDWAVYVIDMTLFDTSDAYVQGNGAETKAIFSFQDRGNGGAEAYLDFAYFAVCDNWDEVNAVTGGEDHIFTSYRDNNVTVGCGDAHVPVFASGTAATGTCFKCGATVNNNVTVGADGVNTYTVPNTTAVGCNRWNAAKMGGDKTAFGNVNYDATANLVYTRVSLNNGGSFEIINGSATPDGSNSTITQTVYGTGKYAVIKLRVNSEAEVKFSATTGTVMSDGELGNHSRTAFADGWAVYVIDLSAFDLYTADDATITKAWYGMQGDSADGGSVDIAYFAVCDNWEEIKTVVDDEQVIITNWNDNNVTKVNLADQHD